jgi:hypothetical protein
MESSGKTEWQRVKKKGNFLGDKKREQKREQRLPVSKNAPIIKCMLIMRLKH